MSSIAPSANCNGSTSSRAPAVGDFRFMVEEMPHLGWYITRELAQRLRATDAAL
jgi:hypothetical protein